MTGIRYTDVSFDSCILIDLLNGVAAAGEIISATEDRALSVVARAEVLAGIDGPSQRARFDRLMTLFNHLGVTIEIADAAAAIRRSLGLKLPDALILATARVHRLPVLTRDAAFPVTEDAIIPYRL